MRNVSVQFPKRLHGKVNALLRQLYDAKTREKAEQLMSQFADLYGRTHPRAVECLLKDQGSLLTYFNYPREHWKSLNTESKSRQKRTIKPKNALLEKQFIQLLT